jgi:hypothetical protein
MTKGLISIFVLPQELDDLHITLYNLKRNSVHVQDCEFTLDVTMNLSTLLTDWEKSKLPQEYFVDKFNNIMKYADWMNVDARVDTTENILGCVSQRRHSSAKDADFHIWLDCDLYFGDTTLYSFVESYKLLSSNGYNRFILTPQFVRQWDQTWDVLVADNYKDHPLMFHEECDIFKEVATSSDIQLRQLREFKFAGGWFTLLSGQLLKDIGVPNEIGHYGLEDTFICHAAKLWNSIHPNTVQQFSIDNLIVGENYKYRNNQYMKSSVHANNLKSIFTSIAHQGFGTAMNHFSEKIRNG